MKNEQQLYKRILTIVLIVGLAVSAFLAYEHFSASASEFCSFGASFDCGIVNKSPYANVDGIFYLLVIDYGLNLPLLDLAGINGFFDFITSNAVLGFLTLLFILLLNVTNKKEDFLFVKKGDRLKWMRGILIFGVLYGAFLFYIQHSILKTYCVFCIALDIILLTSLVLTYQLKE